MTDDQLGTGSLYRRADPGTIELLDELVRDRTPIFVVPSWFVTPEAAQVGFLLSERIADLSGARGTTCRSFFTNSRHESVHGVIKLMRHHAAASYERHRGRVLVLDPGDLLRSAFDPLGEGPERALVPNVHVVATLGRFRESLVLGHWCGLLVREPHHFPAGELAAAAADGDGTPLCLDLSDSDLAERERGLLTALRPDLVIVGERLSGHTVPFSAFTGTTEMFRPWSDAAGAFVHSNTYGGNTLAMRRVRTHLLRLVEPDGRVAETVSAADADWAATLRLYERHVNPVTSALHRKLRGALHVVKAEGTRLTVELDSGRRIEVTDAACGGGLGVNGHNPDDIRTEVLAQHDPERDYGAALEETLARETGLAKAFPGVSGAGAVETAVTLALLAAPPGRRRIVVFDHNYGGKTLVSLLATAAPGSRAPFAPLYEDVVYLDPFAPDAVERFLAEAASGELALVWLELVHGSSDSYAPLPDDLLAAVARERERRRFLVGVDEILTSFYRCGRRFAFHGRLPEVDLVTVSKALSYLCMPVASTVVSGEVCERARQADPGLVEHLRTRFANQLGAHIALHSLSRVDTLGLPERTAALARAVRDCLDSLPERVDPAIRRHFAEGLFVRLGMNPPRLPGMPASRAAELSVWATLYWWITKRKVFVPYDCLGVPLTAGEADLDRITSGIRALAGKTPRALWWAAVLGCARERALARLRRPTTERNRR
nr:aminotransferase class III-fold pyridoxal phosphate-dependent enzyme [Kibdelosporangium sp. MJ126-NF4]CTQ98924.1 Acetylornithine aminotransferase (EC 2.6.1.11) [Kibdelosporangium sp. MJ126-NF4]